MERKTSIIIGVAVGVAVIGIIVGAVMWRRAALLREFEGGGAVPPGQTGTVTQPGAGTVPPGSVSTPEPVKDPPPPGAAAPGNSDPEAPYVPVTPTPNTVDTDGDGLSNEQEASLGTDPNSVDSDGDGLMDGAEVNSLKTDPKAATKNPLR